MGLLTRKQPMQHGVEQVLQEVRRELDVHSVVAGERHVRELVVAVVEEFDVVEPPEGRPKLFVAGLQLFTETAVLVGEPDRSCEPPVRFGAVPFPC